MRDALSRTTTAPVLVVAFTGHEITAVRHAVARRAAGAGLAGDRLRDFVLAVHEIVTNAVVHGGGRGELRMWEAGQTVECEITDLGAGGAVEVHEELPLEAGRRGLRLARLLVDRLEVIESASGTTVRLMSAVPMGT